MDIRKTTPRSGLLLAALLAALAGCDQGPDAAPPKTESAAPADPAAPTETLAFDITGMT